MSRQLIPAARLGVGDLALLGPGDDYVEVERITGSPGRRSATKAPLLRVFLAGASEPVTVRSDEPVVIRPRHMEPADRLRPGQRARLDPQRGYETVMRVTGSPGRRAPGAAPLLRVFLEGAEGYSTVRGDRRIPTLPSTP